MLELCFPPSFSISYSFYSVNCSGVPLHFELHQCNQYWGTFYSTSSLWQINGLASVWIFVCVCLQAKIMQGFDDTGHISVQLWPVAIFSLQSVKVRGSKLTASSLRLDVKICCMVCFCFQLQVQWSRPRAWSSCWDAHHDSLHLPSLFMTSSPLTVLVLFVITSFKLF